MNACIVIFCREVIYIRQHNTFKYLQLDMILSAIFLYHCIHITNISLSVQRFFWIQQSKQALFTGGKGYATICCIYV